MALTLAVNSIYGFRLRSKTIEAAMARAHTGPMVMTKGLIVSLAEFELRSKASNTITVPYRRTASATATPISVPFFKR
jgi:hypothetical protein